MRSPNNPELEFWFELENYKEQLAAIAAKLEKARDALPEELRFGWEISGPHPSVSVITCVDAGCDGIQGAGEPPRWEPICIVDQNLEGEPNRVALAVADWLITCNTAAQEIIRLDKQ